MFFAFDVYSLSDEAKSITQKNFDCLQANAKRTVRVVGYTDPRGSVEYNIGLSDDRSQSVSSRRMSRARPSSTSARAAIQPG